MIRSILKCFGGGGQKVVKSKPGLMLLLRIAWNCRILLTFMMTGFMCGVFSMGFTRIQVEIDQGIVHISLVESPWPWSESEEEDGIAITDGEGTEEGSAIQEEEI